MLAALGKTLLKGKAKKIAKDKLLNRKKKTNKRRMSVKKIMGMDDKPKRGGALALRPTMDLVGNIKDFDPVSDTSGESDIIIIRKQVIQVRDILKDSYTAKKEERDEERKARQTEKREKREEELEKPKVKPKESKGMKMPKPALGIGNFLSWLVFGLVVNKLLELMPQLRKIFRWLKPIINFIGGIFKATMGFVVGFINLSYAGVEKLREGIVAIGGEGAGELFDKFGKLFTQLINGALIAAMVAARVGLFNPFQRKPKLKQPDRSLRNKIKRRRQLNRRFFDPQRTEKLERVKNIKKIQVERQKQINNLGGPDVQGPRQPTLFESIRKRVIPDTPKINRNFLGIDWGKRVGQVREGFQGGMKRVGELGDVVYRNTIGRIDEQLKKLDPGTVLKNLSKGDGVLAKGAQRMLGFFDNPVTRKILNKAPFIGDAIVFLIDLATGKHWVRALLRTIGAIGLDAGFYALLGLTGIAAPFTAGSSLLLSAALLGAYMAADAAAGAALGSEGVGQFLGDFVADKLGVPKMAGETGGGAWKSLFGGGGKISGGQENVEKLIEGVKLSEKDKEIISRVGGGLGTIPNMKGDTKIASNITQNKAQGLDTHPSYAQGGMMVVDNTTTYIQPIEV